MVHSPLSDTGFRFCDLPGARTAAARSHPAFPRKVTPRWFAAFSLVEVTLALGIMSFGFVSLLGMLPVGVANFHSAIDQSSCAQISQRLLGEAQQTDFDQLINTRQTLRYFDVQGNELQATDKASAIYQTNLVTTSATSLPGSVPSNAYLATVSLQIAVNPGNRTIPAGADLRWTAPAGMSILTYAVNVARNK